MASPSSLYFGGYIRLQVWESFGRPPVVGTALSSLLAVDLNSPGYYIHWGFIQLSLANFIVILLMIVVFVVALFAPFPGGKNRP
jgi:hypothetical protein